MNNIIVFTTLAMNQTIFFVGLAKELNRKGYDSKIITFHEESYQYIIENAIQAYNIFSYNKEISNIIEEFEKYIKIYKIDNPNLILSHEKVAFNIKNTQDIMNKYCKYFYALEKIFDDIKQDCKNEITIFQELGGFSSILSTYFYARKENIDNIFIEPSFFRGRVFFVKNSLKSIDIELNENVVLEKEVKKYLDQTVNNKQIVIPSKDKNGYKNPINKIVNLHNLRRLVEKSYSKLFLKKNEEFSYIFNHVKRHVNMLINQIFLKKYYQETPKEKFIYFPMHVPNDVALTVRSPEYLDQLSLINYISRNMPFGYKLAIKEHPAMLGDIDRTRVEKLLNMDSNIVLLQPHINNFDVLEKATFVITINSKAGAEAILNYKHVIVLGDAFYNSCPYLVKLGCLNELFATLDSQQEQEVDFNEQDLKEYFQNVWNYSYKGDLYYNSYNNFVQFANSLINYMEDSK